MGRLSRKARRRSKDTAPLFGGPGPGALPSEAVTWEGGVLGLDRDVLDSLSEGGAAHVPARFAEPPPPLVSIIWVEVETGDVVASTVVPHGELPEAVATVLVDAMWEPEAGAPRRPARVAVADADLADAIRRAVRGTDTSVVVTAALRVFPHVAHEVAEELRVALPHFMAGYLDGEGVTEALGRRFFDAARSFYLARPWTVFHDDPLLELSVDAEDSWVVVMGAAGGGAGLILLPTDEDVLRFRAFLEPIPRDGQTLARLVLDEAKLGESCAALVFPPVGHRGAEEGVQHVHRLSEEEAREIDACSWGGAGNGMPSRPLRPAGVNRRSESHRSRHWSPMRLRASRMRNGTRSRCRW